MVRVFLAVTIVQASTVTMESKYFTTVEHSLHLFILKLQSFDIDCSNGVFGASIWIRECFVESTPRRFSHC